VSPGRLAVSRRWLRSETARGLLEGWYVIEECRGKRLSRRLLAAAEDWARREGCMEMASDTWIDRVTSQRVHEALGFEVVDRCVHYRKSLAQEAS
jgi:aminoglycoside 6'-N-acetyltransferase I